MSLCRFDQCMGGGGDPCSMPNNNMNLADKMFAFVYPHPHRVSSRV